MYEIWTLKQENNKHKCGVQFELESKEMIMNQLWGCRAVAWHNQNNVLYAMHIRKCLASGYLNARVCVCPYDVNSHKI